MLPVRSKSVTLLLLLAASGSAYAAAPIARNAAKTLGEDSSTSIAVRADDPERQALTYYLSAGPGHGTASLSGRTLAYTPSRDFNGTDTVTYYAVDTEGLSSNVATVTFTVSAINDPPVAQRLSATTDEDVAASIALQGTDVDGDALTYSITSNPSQGSVTVDPASGMATYTPPANWSGNTSFRYSVTDGSRASEALVTVTVTAVQDVPVANAATVTGDEDTVITTSLTGSDAENDALTFALSSTPAHGSVGLMNRQLTYTPDADFNGEDSVDFVVSDATGTSTPATITFVVNPMNDAPVADSASFSMDQDTTEVFTLTASDIDGDALTWSVVSGPASGTAEVDAATGEVTVSPDAGFSGTMSFVVEVSDGVATSSATISVEVLHHASGPVVTDTASSVNEDSSVTFALDATDPNGDAISCTLSSPVHGTATLSGLLVTYVPEPDFNGEDTFTFQCSDGVDTSDVATATVVVDPVNDRPTATATTFAGNEDETLTFSLPASDIDGDALTYSLLTAPGAGALSYDAATGAATFTPPANWAGSTSFRFAVTDGVLSTSAVVTLSISAVNDLPVANNASGTLNEDGAVSVGLTATDVDSTSLSYTIVTNPEHGTVTLSGRNATYVPTANYNGADSFAFVVSDGSGTSSPATVSLTVNPVNDPPAAYAVTAETDEDVTVVLNLSGSDIDGDVVSFALENQPGNATVALDAATGVASFTPNPNASGTMSFSYRAYDGTVWSPVASATVTVNSVPDAPTATPQSVTVAEDSGVSSVTLSATDPDASTSFTYALVSMPAHGSAGLTGRTVMYEPAADFHGTDSFTFVASDGVYTSEPATVTITVSAVNDVPLAYSTSAMTDGRAITVELLGADIDGDALSASVGDAPLHGTASIVDGELVYTPDAGFFGMDRFTFVLDDGTATSTGSVRVSSIGAWDGGALANWSQVGVNSLPFYADATSAGPLTASETHLGSYILDDLYSIGAESYRQIRAADVTWQSFEPLQGEYAYGDSDDLYGQDEVEPRFTVFDTMFGSPTPPWATTEAEFESQMNPVAYDYLDAVLARYSEEARYWEICNEMFHWSAIGPDTDPADIPDLPESYPTDGYSPEEQATFLRDAAEYIRAADPDAVIVLPSVLASSVGTDDWLERVVNTVGADWFDVVTYHAYEEWNVTRSERAAFEAQLMALGLDDKLVQLTEVGTTAYDYNVSKTNYPNSPSTQAMDIFRQLLPAFAAGDSAVIWHTYREFAAGDTGTFAGLGLFDERAVPRDSAYTYALFTSELLPIVQVTDLSDDTADRFEYRVRSADGSEHTVLWGSGTVAVPEGATEMVYVVPNAAHETPWLAVSGTTITLTDEPVMFR